MPESPELSDAAASELPAADKPLSQSKGFFSVWVFRALFWVTLGLSGIIIYMVTSSNTAKNTEIKELKQQVTFWQDRYIKGLESKSLEIEKLQDTTAALKQQIK
jgi:hypothetical protein